MSTSYRSVTRLPGLRTPDGESGAGCAASWRHAAPSPVILQVLAAVLLVCLGVLLGGTWTDQLFQARHRRQAEERHSLNEERHRLDEEWTAPTC